LLLPNSGDFVGHFDDGGVLVEGNVAYIHELYDDDFMTQKSYKRLLRILLRAIAPQLYREKRATAVVAARARQRIPRRKSRITLWGWPRPRCR